MEQTDGEKTSPLSCQSSRCIVTHSCYSLQLCDDISDKKKMSVVLSSTIVHIFEPGVSFTLVHSHLSCITPTKSTIYNIFYHDSYLFPICSKREFGEVFF